MDANPVTLKRTAQIALVALGILFIGSIAFFRERIFFADASYILFHIINNRSFDIQEHRYGSFITQIVPYFGQKWHLPIRAIIIGYSVSFNLFYFLIAAFRYRCKQYGFTILMALYYFLFVSSTYFWPNNEIHQAVAWMFLFYGVTIYFGEKQANVLLLSLPFLLLAFVSVSTHFIVIIPVVFLWVYFIIEKKNWPFSRKTSILLSFFLAVVVIAKYFIARSSPYESLHLHGLTHFSLKDILASIATPVVKMFAYRCVVNYWPGIIVFILGLGSLIKDKQILLASWTCISCIGYCVIMGLTYGDLDKNVLLFHIEAEWTCLGILIAAPFIFSFLPKLKQSHAALLVSLVFLIRLCYIGAYLPSFSNRVHFQEEVLTRMGRKGITKLALYNDSALTSISMLDWAYTYETLLTSAMNNENPQRTFFLLNKNDKRGAEIITNPQIFYDPWITQQSRELNKEYFSIDTTRAYQIMTYEELCK